MLLAIVFHGDMMDGLSKFYLDEYEITAKKKIFSGVFSLAMSVSLGLTVLLSVFSKECSEFLFGTFRHQRLIQISSWSLLLETATIFILHLLRMQEKPRLVFMYSLVFTATMVAGNVIFVFWQKLGAEGIMLSQLLAQAVVFTLLLPFLVENYIPKVAWQTIRPIILFSLPIFAGGLLDTAVDVSDRFFLQNMATSADVGVYSFAYRFGMAMYLFVMAFRSAWVPQSVRIIKEKNSAVILGESFSKFIAVGMVIFLVVSLFADDLFSINFGAKYLFNQDYLRGIEVIPVVLIAYLFAGISVFFSAYLYAGGSSKYMFYADGIAFAFNVIANMLLIPKMGIMGAAFATAISFAVSAGYIFIISKRVLPVKIQYRRIAVVVTSGIFFMSAGKAFNLIILDAILLVVFGIIVIYTLKLSRIFFDLVRK